MAKCAVCGKSQSNGNKFSITRSHIKKEVQELGNQI